MNNAQLINQTSGEVEYYTDPKILIAANKLLNGINLDPSSSAKANQHVKANRWFGFDVNGKFIDGMLQSWSCGTLWMNHPFSRKESPCPPDCKRGETDPNHRHHSIPWHGNKAWISKLVQEFKKKNIAHAALCITYAATSEDWFQPLMDYPQCFLSPRTNYYLPDGTIKKGVTKGSVVTYLGPDLASFHLHFNQFGKIKVCYEPKA